MYNDTDIRRMTNKVNLPDQPTFHARKKFNLVDAVILLTFFAGLAYAICKVYPIIIAGL